MMLIWINHDTDIHQTRPSVTIICGEVWNISKVNLKTRVKCGKYYYRLSLRILVLHLIEFNVFDT